MTDNEKGPPPASSSIALLVEALFRRRRVVNIQLLEEGLRTFNYKVGFDSGDPVLLRVYGCDPNAGVKEVALIRLLVRAGIPVPEILEVYPNGFGEVGPFIVSRYVEGITFRQLKARGDLHAIAQAAYSIGETAAAFGDMELYRHCETEHPALLSHMSDGHNAIPELIDSYLASPVLASRLDERVRRRLHQLAWANAPQLSSLQAETRLVHGDFGNRNVLVRQQQGRWRVAAVIDWESAFAGPALFDIGGFLRYERRQRPVREPHFSRGYTSAGGILPEDWWRLARIVDLTRQCQTLTRSGLSEMVVDEVADLVRQTAEDEC
jgi:aminoglycoside phosphotransferase (APT) family kinase protein